MLNYYEQSKLKQKRTYCVNCGKIGHIYKTCTEPIISIGILSFKIVHDNPKMNENLKSSYMNQHRYINDSVNIIKDNNTNYSNIGSINKHINNVKFLLIRRKHTLGYCEFVRGRYSIDTLHKPGAESIDNINHLVSLFMQMTNEEIAKIKTYTFIQLWGDLWQNPSKNKMIHRCEYERSERKFKKIRDSEELVDLDFFTNNVHPKFSTPEWGFPKGRRNYHERNDLCAKREFREETGYTDEDHVLFNKIAPLSETFNGTNNIPYKHIYYISMMESDRQPTIDANNGNQIDEIGDIGWFTYSEVREMLRPYHVERINLLNEFYIFLVNFMIDNAAKSEQNDYKQTPTSNQQQQQPRCG